MRITGKFTSVIMAGLLVGTLTAMPLVGCAGEKATEGQGSETATSAETTETTSTTEAGETAETATTEPAETTTTTDTATSTSPADTANATDAMAVTITVKGDYDGTVVDELVTCDVPQDATVMEALEASGLDYTAENSTYGAYVTSIAGLESTGSNGWIFTVNGETISEGAGAYTLKDGDSVEWEYYVS